MPWRSSNKPWRGGLFLKETNRAPRITDSILCNSDRIDDPMVVFDALVQTSRACDALELNEVLNLRADKAHNLAHLCLCYDERQQPYSAIYYYLRDAALVTCPYLAQKKVYYITFVIFVPTKGDA